MEGADPHWAIKKAGSLYRLATRQLTFPCRWPGKAGGQRLEAMGLDTRTAAATERKGG